MARVPCRLSNVVYCIIYLILYLGYYSTFGLGEENTDIIIPQFDKIEVLFNKNIEENGKDYKSIEFEVRGRNLFKGLQIRATSKMGYKNSLCNEQEMMNFNISEIFSHEFILGRYKILVPDNFKGNLYFCLPQIKTKAGSEYKMPPNIFDNAQNWYHQGPEAYLAVAPSDKQLLSRKTRQDNGNERRIRVEGFRLEVSYNKADFDENGVPSVLADHDHTIRIFGENFVENMTVTFTSEKQEFGEMCQLPVAKGFPVKPGSFANHTFLVDIKLPPLKGDADSFYICIKEGNFNSRNSFIHQGTYIWLAIRTSEDIIPIWFKIIIIIICLAFSSLFSGLNLGLMSMDRTELKILCNTGTAKERRYARVIQPVRNHGNYLLCSILLGNVFVNSIFTILLDDLTSGVISAVFSTIAIVLFGEITPQAICSRHGLAVGAKTIYITKFIMFLTFPLSYPVSKFLDCILGEEIGNVYNRERLKELVKVTTGKNDLDKDEVNIISGALELRKKTVADVMTKIEDVFMLDYDAILDFETVSEIMKSGYSRIPVYEGNRQNIVTVLYIKDLAFVDPDDNTPLKTLCQFYQNPCNFVFEDVTLDVMFRIFKEGNKGHMAFVHRVNNESESDPFYETIGLITLEDVIEELIQAEIMDETDVFTDNRSKRRRTADRRQDFSVFAERRGEGNNRIRISPQLTLAAFQFLSTSVEQFVPSVISETILKRLLKQDIIYHIKKSKEWRTDPACVIYAQGKAADYFVLILEGRVEVTIGKENLLFEGGPFSYFGTQALVQSLGVAESPSIPPSSTIGSIDSLNLDALVRHNFTPDYTVRACTEVIYLKIKRTLYLAAKRATLMERSQKDNTQTNEQFDDEVDKLLHSLDEDEIDTTQRTPSRKRSTRALHQQDSQLSPKTPSLYSNVSPPNRLSQRDINGSIKLTPVDDNISNSGRDEEVSLLPKKT